MLREIEIPKSMGLIVRTAGSRKTKKEIQNDLQNTIGIWGLLRKRQLSQQPLF